MPWQGTSNRRAELPPDWPVRRSIVAARAHGMCEARTHDPRCDGTGRECDHIDGRDNHSLDNLQWLSTPCHKAKTVADKQRWKRQAEPHPGLL